MPARFAFPDDAPPLTPTQQVEDLALWAPPPRWTVPDDWGDREKVTLQLYGDGKGRIADEAAAELGKDFSVIRPAVAILHRQACLRETGAMRRGRKKSAHEYVITDKGRDMLPLLFKDHNPKGAAA